MNKQINRLANAGEKFLMSKTVEVYVNTVLLIFAGALVAIMGFWVLHQLRAMATSWVFGL